MLSSYVKQLTKLQLEEFCKISKITVRNLRERYTVKDALKRTMPSHATLARMVIASEIVTPKRPLTTAIVVHFFVTETVDKLKEEYNINQAIEAEKKGK